MSGLMAEISYLFLYYLSYEEIPATHGYVVGEKVGLYGPLKEPYILYLENCCYISKRNKQN